MEHFTFLVKVELNNRQVTVDVVIQDNKNDLLGIYESVKYSDWDFERRPNRDELIEEFKKDFANALEVAIDDDDDTVVFGFGNVDTYQNDFMSFSYEINDDIVNAKFNQKWSEDKWSTSKVICTKHTHIKL